MATVVAARPKLLSLQVLCRDNWPPCCCLACSDDWRIKLAMPIFLLIDALLKQRSLAQVLFNKFRTPDNIKSVLQSVYSNPAAVDEELIELIYRPSCDQGALDAFVAIITGEGEAGQAMVLSSPCAAGRLWSRHGGLSSVRARPPPLLCPRPLPCL